MKILAWSVFILAALLAAGVYLIGACSDSKFDEPQKPDPTPPGGSWFCNIPTDGMTDMPFVTNCWDPLQAGNQIVIDRVRGTSPLVEKNQRYEIQGHMEFTSIKEGRIEPVVSCPAGSNYVKCTSPFDETIDTFTVRFKVTDCDYLNQNDEIDINVWNADNNLNTVMCQVLLGEHVPDDDTSPADDDTTSTDDDSTPVDDDTTPVDDDSAPADDDTKAAI